MPLRSLLLVVPTVALALASYGQTSSGNRSGEAMPAGDSRLAVVYFHSPSCHDCHEVKASLPWMLRRWEGRVDLRMRDIMEMASLNDLLLYEKHYGVTVSAPPAIFVGGQALIGRDVILAELDGAIAKELEAGAVTFDPAAAATESTEDQEQGADDSQIVEHFKSFRVGAVALAGLIDGVNPCAFTTIVFFLSMLTYLKRSRREVLAVGVAFTVGVFAAYLLLGLGLLGVVKSFSVSLGLSSALSYAVAALAFVLAGWSLWDYIKYRRTKDTKTMSLGLPKGIKERIHKVIRTGLKTHSLVAGSVGIGFLVAMLESLCTGQVYLPTIVFVTQTPQLRAAAVGYLLLYNFMFILPLIVIMTMAYMGVGSDRLGGFFRRHVGLAKVAMCLLFLVLGILVISTTLPAAS